MIIDNHFCGDSAIISRKCCIFAAESVKSKDMSIDTYKLTSMEEPTDEVLSQLMREAAEDARKADAQATERYFYELKQAAAAIK